MNTRGNQPKSVYKNLLVQDTPGSQDSPVMNTMGALTPWSNCTRKFFKYKSLLMFVPNTPRSQLPSVFTTRSRDSPVYLTDFQEPMPIFKGTFSYKNGLFFTLFLRDM
jgi:hypothetical protein